ncbi:hypothetical protein BGZ75_007371 [Mortierella antarctica]|nr:hypothetical protein BGZ75_007371 [Mortierella antarctica]
MQHQLSDTRNTSFGQGKLYRNCFSESENMKRAVEKAEIEIERLTEEKSRVMQSDAPRLDKGIYLANLFNELEDIERAVEKSQDDLETAVEKSQDELARLTEEKHRFTQNEAPYLDKGSYIANLVDELEDIESAEEKAQVELKRLTKELRRMQDKAQYPQGWAPSSYWTPSCDPENRDLWTAQHHEIYGAEKEIFLAIGTMNRKKEREDYIVQEILRTLAIMKRQGGHHAVEWIEKSTA